MHWPMAALIWNKPKNLRMHSLWQPIWRRILENNYAAVIISPQQWQVMMYECPDRQTTKLQVVAPRSEWRNDKKLRLQKHAADWSRAQSYEFVFLLWFYKYIELQAIMYMSIFTSTNFRPTNVVSRLPLQLQCICHFHKGNLIHYKPDLKPLQNQQQSMKPVLRSAQCKM